MPTLTPKLGLKKPVVNVETDWGSRLNETIDILDGAALTANISALGNVTYTDSGGGPVTISGKLLVGQGSVIIGTQGTAITISGTDAGALSATGGLFTISIPGGTVISGSSTATSEPTGFADRTSSDFTFNEATRMFGIWPTTTGSYYEYWIKGDRFRPTTTQTLTISNADGNHAIYFDGTTLVDDTTITIEDVIRDNAYIALVTWNTGSQTATIVADERHGITMDYATHAYLHRTAGARYIDGLTIGNYTTAGAGTLDTDAQFSIANGTIADEDLEHSIVHSSSPSDHFEQVLQPVAFLPVFVRSGTGDSNWIRQQADGFAVKRGALRIHFNEDSGGGNWVTTEAGNNRYVASWILATNDRRAPVIALLGQNESNSLDNAREADTLETFSFGSFPTPEARVLYRLIFQTGVYGNTPGARLRDVTDYRTAPLSTITVATPDHGALLGLLDDDHPQYLLADGTREASGNFSVSGTLSVGSGTIQADSYGITISGVRVATLEDAVISGSGWQAYRTINTPVGSGTENINATDFLIVVSGEASNYELVLPPVAVVLGKSFRVQLPFHGILYPNLNTLNIETQPGEKKDGVIASAQDVLGYQLATGQRGTTFMAIGGDYDWIALKDSDT